MRVCVVEEASDSDEEATMREAMKKETQLLVESKSKKKTQDDDDDDEGKGKRRRRH